MRTLVFLLAALCLASVDARANVKPSLDTPALASPVESHPVGFALASIASGLALGFGVRTVLNEASDWRWMPITSYWIGAATALLLDIPLHMFWGRMTGLDVTPSKAVIGAGSGVVAALVFGALFSGTVGWESGDTVVLALYGVLPLAIVSIGGPVAVLTAVHADEGDEGARMLDAQLPARRSEAQAWLKRMEQAPRTFGVPLASMAF